MKTLARILFFVAYSTLPVLSNITLRTENNEITFSCHHFAPFGAEGAHVQIQWSTPSSSR